ncbi:MAG: VanZ family protein [Bacilli bacterium]|nr:VanZ family protein [Bacilli bacterium]
MINTIRNMITEVLPDVWPVIIIITVIACTFRIAYLINNRVHFCFYKELLSLVFILYVMCLFEVVTLQDNNYGLSNLIPFKEIFRYSIGSRLFIKNIVGNILLFLPYGYFIGYYVNDKKIISSAILTMFVSVTIEVVQLKIGRTFDIDDVILNTCGGVIGFTIYIISENISKYLPKIFKTDGFINFIVVVLLIFVIIFLFNINVLGWFNNS